MLGDLRVDERASMALQLGERALFILSDQPAVPGDVGR
jgi:hypothetical protein